MSTPLFYAELLSNIRSITVSIHLQSPFNSSTKLSLSTPSQLQLHHNGETVPFNLPASVAPSASLLLKKTPAITPGQTKLSYRLPAAPELCSTPSTLAGSENYVPWSALSLSSYIKDVSLHCKSCSSKLVSSEEIRTWKDLPSGNWADMMDFWHCHKPDTESRDGNATESKYAVLQRGYTAVDGTALVELTYFLIAEGDCGGAVEVVKDVAKTRHPRLCCNICKVILGTVDTDGENPTRGWRLNKWNVKLQFAANGMFKELSYPMAPFLSAQLLAFAEGEGIRRLIVSRDDDDDDNDNDNDNGSDGNKESSRLKLWLFNTNIKYTSSSNPHPIRAVKVFYQAAGAKERAETGQGTSLGNEGFEEVRLAKEMVKGLREELESSTGKLLEELKQFREWKVGTLQRFEPEHV